MPTFDSDKPLTVLGVPGRLTHRTTKPGQAPGLWCNQRWISESRSVSDDYGPGARMCVEMRFDDECGNGHNTFAITADVYKLVSYPKNRRDSSGQRREDIAGGCLHEDIAKHFPELASLIKWHLTSSDGPMHYIANTVYHAGDRDCWGTRKGEPRQWEVFIQFGNNPIKHKPGRGDSFVKFLPYYHEDHGKPGKYQFEPKYTFGGFADKWHECPFDTEQRALDFLYALQHCNPKFVRVATSWGEGKERDLAAARATAIWPDAPDAILCADKETLTKALQERHPALMQAFRNAMEGAGFLWAPELAEA